MQFRVRPSSKKSSQHQSSIVEFPSSKSLAQPLPRGVNSRIDQLEASLGGFQDMYRRERQLTNASYIQIQKRLDRLQYKSFSAEQQLRQLGEMRQLKPVRQSYVPQVQTSKNQLMMLKQMILQQKDAQKETIKHQNTIIQQLSIKQLRAQQELREALGNQRRQYQQRLSGHGQDLREIQGLKQRKMDQQYEMIKGIIANAERKIYDQLQRKIRGQTVVRDFIQQRIASLQEQLAGEHRQTLAMQAKFVRETKQSLQNLFGLVASTRKQLADQLAQTQKLAVNSIKKVSMGLQVSKEKNAQQIKQLTVGNEDVLNELRELREFVTQKLEENRQMMADIEDRRIDGLQGNNSNSSRVDSGRQDQGRGQRMGHIHKQFAQWKSLTQQKNLNVFKQISNTLKTMKGEWRKENDELVGEISALGDSLREMKKNAPNQLKKSVQALVAIFNSEFDVLAQELQALTEMIALAKRQNDKATKEQLSKQRESMMEEIKVLLSSRGKESNLYTDKAIARSEQTLRSAITKQSGYLSERIGQRVEKVENGVSTIEAAVKKSGLATTAQLEQYSVRLKKFNENYKDYLEEQRRQDLKKRNQLEQAMRKNASSLMEMGYKKSEFLVDGLKKNIEMTQMKQKLQSTQALQTAKDQLKKDMLEGKLQWQNQLNLRAQKLTKDREGSEEVLHEAIQQSISNAKRNLSNEIGNAKLQLQQKLNEHKQGQLKKDQDNQAQIVALKNNLLEMLREQKKLTEQNMLTNRKQVQDRMVKTETETVNLTKAVAQHKIATKKETEEVVAAAINKEQQAQLAQAQQTKVRIKAVNDQVDKLKAEIAKDKTDKEKDKLQSDKKKAESKKVSEEAAAGKEKVQKEEMQRLKTEIAHANNQKIAAVQKRIELVENNSKTKETENTVKSDQTNKQIAALEGRVTELDKKIQAKKGEQDKAKEAKAKQDKLKEDKAKQDKAKQQGKVGEQKLNKLKADMQKMKQQNDKQLKQLREQLNRQIRQLQTKVQSGGKENDQQDENMASLKKSVNKLEAMVFSEQAKNKTMFDRMTEDINKLTQNLDMITNELR